MRGLTATNAGNSWVASPLQRHSGNPSACENFSFLWRNVVSRAATTISTNMKSAGEFFERRQDYNPGDDSIVRTSARQLRTKVREYFDSEGLNEPLILEIPKGGYVPVFKKREARSQNAAEPPLTPSTVRRWQIIAGLLALVSICLLYALNGFARSSKSPGKSSRPPTIVSNFLQGTTQPTRIIVGDYGAILMSTLARRQFSVEEYANGNISSTPLH